MKQSLNGLRSIKRLKNNYLSLRILAALLILSLCSSAQYDSTKILQAIQAYGFTWKNSRVISSLIPPNDTVKLALKDSGAIAYKGGNIWSYNGVSWVLMGGGGG